MVQYFTQHIHTWLIDVFRVCVWLTIVSVIFIRVKKEDLEGIDPMAAPAA